MCSRKALANLSSAHSSIVACAAPTLMFLLLGLNPTNPFEKGSGLK
jgi:hypothetical protein